MKGLKEKRGQHPFAKERLHDAGSLIAEFPRINCQELAKKEIQLAKTCL